MSAFGFSLAAVAAKTVYSIWSSGSVSSDTPNGLIDVVSASLANTRDQRAATRQISSLTEAIYDNLEPLIAHELSNLDPAETLAIIESVQTTIDLKVADAKAIVSAGLDADLLEKMVKPDAQDIAGLGLSDPGAALYDLLLSETCAYVIQIAASLPGFETEAAREILRREAALMERATEMLQALPKSPVPHSWGTGDESARFETKYLRKVAVIADRLELFGVSSPTARRPYALSVAYISLSISSNVEHRSPAPTFEESDTESTRANNYFDSHDQVLLLGDAGSGKTTLLRWLASTATRRSASPGGTATWHNRVPFIIPLRQFLDKPLPTPAEYVSLTAPNMADVCPRGWAHNILESGRGALLVDGLDELPVERRDEVLAWITEIDADFPGNAILVTSRGAAIENNLWKDQSLLECASLQQMELGDIQSFVNHWHDAMSEVVTSDEQVALKDANSGMLNVIRTRSNIRNLSQTPLLCALMCALHLENAASLPNDRMSLYRTALEMLVMKRDNDRKLARTDDQLTLSDRLILLKQLALWMHENGYAEIRIADYRASIARTLPALSKTGWGVDETAQFLLERCGVLREPSPRTVDFIHRSFLEYLAASAEVDDDSIAKLLLHATEEPWREVIILANGHANNAQRNSLLTGLLKRGWENSSERHILFLLAVACLQTAPYLELSIREQLQKALNEVVPPTNMGEASAVAAAGDSAAPLLKRRNLKVMEAVASVRALSLIGSVEALEALKSYRREHRVTVIRQLIRAWPAFETEAYAREVLIESPFIRGHYAVTELDQLPFLRLFDHLETIEVAPDTRLESWTPLDCLNGDSRVTSLTLPSVTWMEDLRDVPVLPALGRLFSPGSMYLESLKGIEKFESLEEIHLVALNLHTIDSLNTLEKLRIVDLTSLSLRSLDQIRNLRSPLELLDLSVGSSFSSFGDSISARKLVVRRIGGNPQRELGAIDVSALASSPRIRELTLFGLRLPPVVHLPPNIETLYIDQTDTTYLKSSSLKSLVLHGPLTEAAIRLVENSPLLDEIRFAGSARREDHREILERFAGRSGLKISFFSFTNRAPLEVSGFEVERDRFLTTYCAV